MASTATAAPQGSLRQRNAAGSSKKSKEGAVDLDELAKAAKAHAPTPERDYQITFVLITALAFVTRFWGISHPNEVVFDEVHFGKVNTELYCSKSLRQAHGD